MSTPKEKKPERKCSLIESIGIILVICVAHQTGAVEEDKADNQDNTDTFNQ